MVRQNSARGGWIFEILLMFNVVTGFLSFDLSSFMLRFTVHNKYLCFKKEYALSKFGLVFKNKVSSVTTGDTLKNLSGKIKLW